MVLTQQIAFVWEAVTDFTELLRGGWTESGACAINEAGQIIGSFSTATETHVYLPKPNP